MKYVIYTTTNTTDGNQTTTRKTVNATDARTARMHIDAHTPNGATVRVYPHTGTDVGIMRGAVMVARRTAINAIKRQGTETQYRIEREFAAINARLVGAETPERVNAVISTYSPDVQDFYSIALLGLQEGKAAGLSIPEQYSVSYRALNAHIHSLNAATEYELSTEFLTDGGGDLVAINAAIASIIRGGDKWTPTDGGEMDAATAARLGAAIADAMRTVTPTQRKIAELLGRGYSQRKIAEKTRRNERTVKQNIAIMRGKVSEHIREHSPEFVQLIRKAETAAAAAAAGNRRTADGAAREKENCKARHGAEYYREYRARKAVTKAWAEWIQNIDTLAYIDEIDGACGMNMIADFCEHIGADLLGEKSQILIDITKSWEMKIDEAINTILRIETLWNDRDEINECASDEWDEYENALMWACENACMYGGEEGIQRIKKAVKAHNEERARHGKNR